MTSYIFSPPATFDFSTVVPRALMPKGTYIARIVETNLRENSDGSRSQKIEYEIMDGIHKGRKITQSWFITTNNDYQEAVKYKNFSALSVACQYKDEFSFEDLSCFHGRTLWIEIFHRAGKDNRTYHEIMPTSAPSVLETVKEVAKLSFKDQVMARIALKAMGNDGSVN